MKPIDCGLGCGLCPLGSSASLHFVVSQVPRTFPASTTRDPHFLWTSILLWHQDGQIRGSNSRI